MVKIESDNTKCPNCGKPVYADIFEVETNTNIPTEAGFHTVCNDNFPFEETCHLDYSTAIELDKKVYQWLAMNTRKIPL
ncbi:hypothetical protein [Leeuwenhoekiella sp. CH_XMU1409-2]|uniref:hypothetical protein n=1 Tax=Leeuwenhoekiella sp. CH_XMU1409-2 TaxID=3107768 RepID=UPI003007F36E